MTYENSQHAGSLDKSPEKLTNAAGPQETLELDLISIFKEYHAGIKPQGPGLPETFEIPGSSLLLFDNSEKTEKSEESKSHCEKLQDRGFKIACPREDSVWSD